MDVSIDHPTDKVNFAIVTVCGIDLAFSYRTIIGIRVDWKGWVLRVNDWGPTTGKHLNYLNEDKNSRLEGNEFDKFVTDVFADMVSS